MERNLREEFEIFLENEEFSGQLDKAVYDRVIGTLKQRGEAGDSKASTALDQLTKRWENGNRKAVEFAKHLKRYDIDITEL